MKFHENSSLGPDGRERFSGAAWLIIVHFSSVLSMESEFPFAFGEFQQGASFAAVSFFGRKKRQMQKKRVYWQ